MVPIPVMSGGGGGLQSSPNVPAPGTSINPSTDKPFSAGMTRAELEAKKAADLSGREQAARQLAGPGLSRGSSELSTPGRELPGGWGRESSLPRPSRKRSTCGKRLTGNQPSPLFHHQVPAQTPQHPSTT